MGHLPRGSICLSAAFRGLMADPRRRAFPRLLRRRRYANLDFCAVECAERSCARAFCRIAGLDSGGIELA